MHQKGLVSTLAVAAALAAFTQTASAVITYGTLDNFDVINDTGGECHGFEIELEGILAADVLYTFGAPYQRYGDPAVLPNATGTGVIIRYAALYDPGSAQWSATTPFTAPPYLPTQGHSCWTGGVVDPAQYYSCGCDHFGASLNATPTRTTYRWLVETSPGSGILRPFGSDVPLPAPVWNVTPPPQPGAQPVAAAAIAPPAPDQYEFGDAIWVKVYTTELPNGLDAADLVHLVVDDPEVDIVPNEPAEVEIEWVLLQASAENDGEQEFGGAAPVGEGNEAVSRRFEFYRYAGAYDLETHEALCDNPDVCPEAVGALIGAQNVAINLAGPLPPLNQPPVSEDQIVTTAEDSELEITLAATDANGDSLAYRVVTGPAHGTLGGTPPAVTYRPVTDYNGPDSFTFRANDGTTDGNLATVSITVTPVNDAPVADAGAGQIVHARDTVQLNGSGSRDVDGDTLTFVWTLMSKPPHSRATLTGATSATPTFRADRAGTYEITLTVNDGVATSAPATVTIESLRGKRN